MNVIALVPAFNEASRIGATIQAVRTIPDLSKVVVIDDGSQDHTADVARMRGADVLRLTSNQGKGGALNAGYQHYTADIYLLLDADLESSAVHAGELLVPIVSQQADLVIADLGDRQISNGTMGFGLAKRLARSGIRMLTGFQANSPLSGQRAVRKQVLDTVGGFAAGFGVEVSLTVRALRHGFVVHEHPLPMTHRATGRGLNGFCHRGKQLRSVAAVLWREWKSNRDT